MRADTDERERTEAERVGAGRWHAGIAFACALGGAASLAAFGQAAAWAAVGLGAAACVGALGALWKPTAERERTALAVLWALAAALAAGVSGGVDGPLAALALLPAPAAAVLGLGWEVGLALSLAVLASTAFGEACGLAARRAGGGLDPALALARGRSRRVRGRSRRVSGRARGGSRGAGRRGGRPAGGGGARTRGRPGRRGPLPLRRRDEP